MKIEKNILFKKALLLADKENFLDAKLIFRQLENDFSADPDFNFYLGLTELNLGEYEAAIFYLNESTKSKKNIYFFQALGSALHLAGMDEDAIAAFDEAIKLNPSYPDAWNDKGNVLIALNDFEQSIVCFSKAIKLDPMYAEAYSNLAITFENLKDYSQALFNYLRAFELKPEIDYLLGSIIYNKMHVCEWTNYTQLHNQLIARVQKQERACLPFSMLALTDDPSIHKLCSQVYAKDKCPANDLVTKFDDRPVHSKIRIGYYSADFYNHATMHLMAELFEYHDKAQFELYAFSFGPNTQDEWLERVKSSFNHFFDVSGKSDVEIAMMSRDLEIDIAIDLKGFTLKSRPRIFALHPAPIKVSYLGFPGTMGCEYMDYIIADRVLIPEDKKQNYLEKVVFLPNTYQANVRDRDISFKTYSRAEMGIPEDAFVFCSFNDNYKITPNIFDSWMRILKEVDGSVLWILKSNDSAAENLRKEAELRGVSGDRLLFASFLPVEEHLKRIQLADLFLDTFPYNAHTTASDALRVGLPIVTLMGESFASRVAASLLTAVGLPELITTGNDEYEFLAIKLAINPSELKSIKARLLNNLNISALYDSKLFAQHLDSAYIKMYELYQQGIVSEHINIDL